MSGVIALDLGSSAIAAVEVTTTRERVSLTPPTSSRSRAG